MAAVIALAASAVIFTAEPSFAVYSGWLEIFNRGSGKCVTASGGSAVVQQYCDSLASQYWQEIGSPGGIVQFQNAATGLCLTAPYPVNGAPVGQVDCHQYPPPPGQLWLLTHVTQLSPSAEVAMFQVFSNSCLDLENGQTQDGVPMQVWTCNPNTNNQKWDVYPA